MLDLAQILSELEKEREVLEDALKSKSDGPPPNPDLPPGAGGAAQLASIGTTRSRRETNREPS